MIRRLAVLALAALALVTLPAPASAHHRPGPCDRHWTTSTWAVKRNIACAARLYGVAVGTSLRVASCESRFDPHARNWPYLGLYQHGVQWWGDRLRAHGVPFATSSIFNARQQTFVTMRMVRAGGWGPWACA